MSNQKLLRIKDVVDKTGISRTKVYLLIQEGKFPAPIKLGERVALWPEAAVDQWITDLVKAAHTGDSKAKEL